MAAGPHVLEVRGQAADGADWGGQQRDWTAPGTAALKLRSLVHPLQVLSGIVGDDSTSEAVLELLLSHLVPPKSQDNPLACQ
jgi:hypothetical protein